MLVTVGSFILMAIAVRALSERLGTFQLLFARSLIGVLILLPVLFFRGPAVLRVRSLGAHALRNVVHFGGQFGWIFAVPLLPLAQVFAIEFSVPIWVGVLAWLFLNERIDRRRAIALGCGFVGVLIVLRPGQMNFEPVTLVVLGAAIGFAGSVVFVKHLTKTDHPLSIVFYMLVMQLPISLGPALGNWVHPTWAEYPWLFVLGATALSAHYAMARALQLADAVVVVPMEFLRVPLVAVLGYFLYEEALEGWVLFGALVILIANFQLLRGETNHPQGR